MPLISVIVPIYNMEPFLRRCVTSIINQTFEDLEIILVNDGSTDTSGDIIWEIAAEDSRVKVISQTNQGVSAARNEGLKAAKGKYIGFVDADDYIKPDMYENLLNALVKYQADIACCGYQTVFENGQINSNGLEGLQTVMDRNSYIMHLFDAPRTVLQSLCNKLFIRGKITEYFNEAFTICEDSDFLINYVLNIKTAVIVHKVGYCMYQNEKSATRRSKGKTALGLKVRKSFISRLKKIDSQLSDAAEKDFLDNCLQHCNIMKNDKKSEYYRIAINYLRDYLKKNKTEVFLNPQISWKLKMMIYYKAAKG